MTMPARSLRYSPPRNGRLLWADLIRVYAIAAVVLLHCAAVPNTQFGEIPICVWWQSNVYASFVCTCVPLFVLLSGALLLTQTQWDSGTFFRKRVSKILLPLLAWTLIYAAWRKFMWKHEIALDDLFGHFLSGLKQPIFPHLWFLYLIVSLYLITPIFRIYFLHSSWRSQLYFIALWIITGAFIPLLNNHFKFQIGLYLDPFFGYVGYFLLGATMLRFLPGRISARWIAVCWATVLVGYSLNMFGTYRLSLATGKLDDSFYQHLSPTVMAMSAASFALLRHYGVRAAEYFDDKATPARHLATLSGLTFGVYLVHALVIVMLESGRLGFTLNPMTTAPILAAPLMATVVFAISVVLTALLRRTSALRWLTP
jgi:surface polysaccharide O-acyltransferase-like enzyme